MIEQIAALLSRPVGAHMGDSLRIVLSPTNGAQEGSGKARPAETRHAASAGEGLDRHDAGDDGHRDSGEFTAFTEVVEVAVVEEELGYDGIGAGVHLALEVVDIGQAIESFRVTLGVPGDADTEAGEEFTNKGNKFARVTKCAQRRGRTGRHIAAQREDILNAGLNVGRENFLNLGAGVTNAGEMGNDGDPSLGVKAEDEVASAIASRSAGSVGHGNEGRGKGAELLSGGMEFVSGAIALGREELEGDAGRALGEDVTKVHTWDTARGGGQIQVGRRQY